MTLKVELLPDDGHGNPKSQAVIEYANFSERLEINRFGISFLSVSTASRDALVSANAFLVILKNHYSDNWQIQKIIDHISDMLYGFESE